MPFDEHTQVLRDQLANVLLVPKLKLDPGRGALETLDEQALGNLEVLDVANEPALLAVAPAHRTGVSVGHRVDRNGPAELARLRALPVHEVLTATRLLEQREPVAPEVVERRKVETLPAEVPGPVELLVDERVPGGPAAEVVLPRVVALSVGVDREDQLVVGELKPVIEPPAVAARVEDPALDLKRVCSLDRQQPTKDVVLLDLNAARAPVHRPRDRVLNLRPSHEAAPDTLRVIKTETTGRGDGVEVDRVLVGEAGN